MIKYKETKRKEEEEMNKDKRKNKKELRRKNKERKRREEDYKKKNKQKQRNETRCSTRKEKRFYGNAGNWKNVLLIHRVQNDLMKETREWLEIQEKEYFNDTNEDIRKREQDYSPPHKLSGRTEERKSEQKGEDKEK